VVRVSRLRLDRWKTASKTPNHAVQRTDDRFGYPAKPPTTEAMMKRSLLCFGFLMILDGSGFSQPVKAEPAFYVVLNSLTKHCTVADKMPRTDTPNITVASDTIYRSRAEAETAIKTLAPCNH
jgi:hypothetical protein